MNEEIRPDIVRIASVVSLICGIWLFLTPIIYGAFGNPNKYNGFTVGGLIILFSAIRVARPAHGSGLSWMLCIFAAWTCMSPIIFRFGIEPRSWNNVAIGLITLLCSIAAAHATPLEPVHPGPLRMP